MAFPQHTFTLTKIIATLGPASSSEEVIRQLILAGTDVFRINFSHGTPEDYTDLLGKVRRISTEFAMPVAVMGDLPGPKIRVGEVAGKGVTLTAGRQVEFVNFPVMAAENAEPTVFSTNYPSLLNEVKPGERILIDDGNVALVCREIQADEGRITVRADVISGGRVTSHKGINLPDSDVSLPAITERDEQLARFAVENGFDYLAVSFVRSAENLRQVKQLLQALGARPAEFTSPRDSGQAPSMIRGTYHGFIPVVSKIEKPQAVRNLEEILAETDIVMVARGDLGVEMDLAEVAIIQKKIIRQCRAHGVPVIVATQMLQSMASNPVPTRAEVSDVANAIFDGTDAVMLSGETAVGRYPVEAVRTMNRIAVKANEYIREGNVRFDPPGISGDLRHRITAMASSAKAMAEGMKVKYIGVWSELGGSAGFLSQYRITVPVLAFTSNERTLRLLNLLFGIQPVFMEKPANSRDFILRADEIACENGWASTGDPVVYVFREPLEMVGFTNQIALHFIGEGI